MSQGTRTHRQERGQNMKLWKVKVNNWGWDRPQTFYAKTREEAQEIAGKYPAADKIQYAGNYSEARAKELLYIEDEKL